MRRLVVADRVRTAGGLVGDAVLIENGKVAAVGDASTLRDGRTEEVRHAGVIIPGLVDAHFHPFGFALEETGLKLGATNDFDELAERIQAAASELPPGSPVLGRGLNDETLAERRLPTRHDLDKMAPGRSVLLNRVCGHLAVASTGALEAAGISPTTADPVGGSFDRDASGMPTGILRETAVAVVTEAIGDLVPVITAEQVLDALRRLPALGLTGIGAIVSAGTALWCGAGDEVATLVEMAPDLPVRLSVLVSADSPEGLERRCCLGRSSRRPPSVPRVEGLRRRQLWRTHRRNAHAIRRRSRRDRNPPDRCSHRVASSTRHRHGGNVAIHAIGDRAVARVLDLFEELIDGGTDPSRLRMEHASVTLPEDIERFAALGVTASVQPGFLPSETGWLERRLGRDRMRWTYAFASLAAAGVPLAGGSDSPVESPEPLPRDGSGTSPGGDRPRGGPGSRSGPGALHRRCRTGLGAAGSSTAGKPCRSGRPGDGPS